MGLLKSLKGAVGIGQASAPKRGGMMKGKGPEILGENIRMAKGQGASELDAIKEAMIMQQAGGAQPLPEPVPVPVPVPGLEKPGMAGMMGAIGGAIPNLAGQKPAMSDVLRRIVAEQTATLGPAQPAVPGMAGMFAKAKPVVEEEIVDENADANLGML